MKRSTERILSTHVGSLARPLPLLELMREKENGRPYDRAAFEREVRQAVTDVVRQQADAGIDVVTDGEMGKVTFATYVNDRLSGFEAAGESTYMRAQSWSLEAQQFPEYYADYFQKYSSTVAPIMPLVCTGPVAYVGQAAVQTDIANLKAALVEVDVEEAFMPATIPFAFAGNQHYASQAEFVEAIGEAMREEYKAILDAGLVLQIDDPGLVEMLNEHPDTDLAERKRLAQEHVEQVNYSLRGFPPEQMRLHVCYGLNQGPRIHDVPLREVVPFMLQVNVGAYSFEVANPRHMHEWRVWDDVRLPAGKSLIPGMISHGTVFVEHPELIADQLETYARVVGRENVMAGADCGFSSRATFKPEIDPRIVWAKLASLSEGARIASERLFG